MSDYLRDPETLFVLLTAIVKKNDGEFILTDDDLVSVTKSDLLYMKYDQKRREFVFTVDGTKKAKASKDKVEETFTFGKKEIKYEN